MILRLKHGMTDGSLCEGVRHTPGGVKGGGSRSFAVRAHNGLAGEG